MAESCGFFEWLEKMQVQLKVVNGKQAGQLITINRPKFMIGRADDCHLKPRNELISRYHCVILIEEGYAGIRDLGSRNGVFVNDEKIDAETELQNGDKIKIGPLEFEVVISVAVSAGKKPKVESIADIVARTVEQNSLSGSDSEHKGNGKEGGLVDLLLDDPNETGHTEETMTMKSPTGKMKKEPVEEQAVPPEPKTAPKPAPQPVVKPIPKPVPKSVQKETKPAAPKVPPAAPGETANALKNFFKNR